jgi:hypothetical protein
MDSSWGISRLFSEPPAVELKDVYDIGYADGNRNLGRRQTFMLHRWGAEQQRQYDQGYRDGQGSAGAATRQPVPAGFTNLSQYGS